MNSVPKLIWVNIIFFGITTLGALVGAPIYVYHYGISAPLLALTVFYIIVTGMSITVGYHRLFAHSTFKAHPVVQFFVLFFGAAAFEQQALDWCSQHRDHHRYVDTDLDPYSIKKGFWYAHIGWLLFWKHQLHYENSKDLQKNTLLMHQDKHYHLWAFGSGIVLPVIIGALFGQWVGALLLAVCFRLVFVHHATFCINSVCHMFGKPTYDIDSTAKDHWFVAFLTNGEGYHNFHHHFPTDYRNGVRWYQWDPSKWAIALLGRMGLVTDLKRVSKFDIFEARFVAEKQIIQKKLLVSKAHAQALHALHEAVNAKYERLIHTLATWETQAKAYRATLVAKTASYSEEWKKNAAYEIKNAKEEFFKAKREWSYLTSEEV